MRVPLAGRAEGMGDSLGSLRGLVWAVGEAVGLGDEGVWACKASAWRL